MNDADTIIDRAELDQLRADAARLEKLLAMVTECKVKFGPKASTPRQLTLTVKASVTTSIGYRNELCKLLDETIHEALT